MYLFCANFFISRDRIIPLHFKKYFECTLLLLVHTADCSVQTEDITKISHTYENRAVMDDVDGDHKENEFVTDDGDKAARAVC